MILESFISANNVLHTTRLIDEEQLQKVEEFIGLSFGPQLKEYILKYGYLSYKHSELYGINSNQNLDSDLVKQTLYLHNYFHITRGFIALENQGEGDYYIVDEDDNVYEYDTEIKELNKTNMKVFDYILQRFQSL